jgi:hypothetical protein
VRKNTLKEPSKKIMEKNLMSKVTITISGKNQMSGDAFETARQALLDIASTGNIAGKTVQDALTDLVKVGGYKGFAESLKKLPDTAKVEIFENGKPAAVYEARKFGERILVASRAEEFTGTIFTTKKGKTEETAEQSAPVLEL